MNRLTNSLRWLALALIGCWAAVAQAATYSNVYVFGDSLSDIGNLHAIDNQYPVRFSNGPLAVETLAGGLGFQLTPSLHLLPPSVVNGQYGNDYAVAGAVAIDADGNPATADINVPTQVNAFLMIHGGHAPSDALYVVMIGGNDIFAAQDIMIKGSWNSGAAADQRLQQAAAAVKTELQTLIAAGARNILVVDAPDVGKTPMTGIKAAALRATTTTLYGYFLSSELRQVSRWLSQDYDLRLDLAVAEVEEATGLDIKQYSLFNFLDKMVANPTAYGYTNVTDPCIFELTKVGVSPGCNFNTWLFYDEIHPTSVTHQRAGQEMLQLVQ